jgi:DNA-binding CsgD family transcriptional regulator
MAEAAPHDALVAYLNFLDFSKTWRATKILATDNAIRPISWFDARRQVDISPPFVLSQRRKVELYRLSDVISDAAALQRTPFFRDYLAPAGWHHMAVTLFWRGSSVCSGFALRRTRAQGDFTAEEMQLLAELRPHIEMVKNRLIRKEDERVRRVWLEEFNDHLPFALLSLSLDFDVVYVNREGLEHCARWNFGPERARAYQPRDVFRVPEPILNACVELKARWFSDRSEPPAARFSIRSVHPQHRGLVANVVLQTEIQSDVAMPGFVIHLSNGSDLEQRASELPIYSMLAELTVAERDIVRLVLAGKSNAEIAAELRKSVNTVKCQLTCVYKKLGIASRSQLLARIR